MELSTHITNGYIGIGNTFFFREKQCTLRSNSDLFLIKQALKPLDYQGQSKAAFTLPQKLARLNRAGLGPDLAHFSGTVYIATKTSSVDPSPVRGARLYVLPFYSFLVE